MSTAADQGWRALPFDLWQPTCDTLHAHSQLLGKLAVALAPPEPQLQHSALRLTGRGWETAPLPAPDGSGALVALLDLHAHETVIEHSDGRGARIPLTPDRAVGEVTRDVLAEIGGLVGPVHVNVTPQEVPWTVPLDRDDEHRTYEIGHVSDYFAVATQVGLALAELRAPYRGRSSPVNAWWGSFDLAVSWYSGTPAEPPSQDFITRNYASAEQIEVGWWPGDARYPRPAFFAFAVPQPAGFAEGNISPEAAGWNAELGEYVLDWDDVIAAADPHGAVLEFGRSILAHACMACGWEPGLAASAQGEPPPIT